MKDYTINFLIGILACCCVLACSTVAGFSATSQSPVDAVKEQLGYVPPNFVSVSAWKLKNDQVPVAIKTYPLHGGAKRRQNKADRKGDVSSPFPTLYWLTCPEISRAVADFERRGYIQIFESELKSDPELARRLIACHEEYAKERWESLTDEDRASLCHDDSSLHRMRNMLESSGISGTNFTIHNDEGEDGGPFVASIKCLHAHYAHYRSTMMSERTQNPVGEMIHERLEEEFPHLEL